MRKVTIEESWRQQLGGEFNSPLMKKLSEFLRSELKSGKKIYPPGKQIFRAFELTSFHDVRVVILGQDPYHGRDQAHGLSFSVDYGSKLPPSLQNIFKELHSDLGIKTPDNGNLQDWAKQGVLLLNSVLTVVKGEPASHSDKGWEIFTDKVIEILNQKENLVFMLWGSYAQKKGSIIDTSKHCVLKAPHPSPLSAHRGFFGSKHFSKANQYLVTKGKTPIKWTQEEINY